MPSAATMTSSTCRPAASATPPGSMWAMRWPVNAWKPLSGALHAAITTAIAYASDSTAGTTTAQRDVRRGAIAIEHRTASRHEVNREPSERARTEAGLGEPERAQPRQVWRRAEHRRIVVVELDPRQVELLEPVELRTREGFDRLQRERVCRQAASIAVRLRVVIGRRQSGVARNLGGAEREPAKLRREPARAQRCDSKIRNVGRTDRDRVEPRQPRASERGHAAIAQWITRQPECSNVAGNRCVDERLDHG